jgi:putrescine transport system substrate-binding protein
MRKALMVISSLLLVPLTLNVHAATDVNENNTLRLYNWADYIGEKTIADFEKASGIKVIYDTFDAYETVQAKLLTGHSGYDLVVLNASLAPPLIKAKVFQPLDKKLLPGWTNLDPKVLQDLQGFDAGTVYSAPYTWGSNGNT